MLPRAKRTAYGPSSSPTSSPTPSPSTTFTYAQVQRIVAHALEVREGQVRQEYNEKLNELLCEQFESFTCFNRDYISRQFQRQNAEDCPYLS